MKLALAVLAFAASGLVAGQAEALNTLYLTNPDPDNNLAVVSFLGSDNVLSVSQQHDGLGPANSLDFDITGDFNGAPLGAAFGGLPAATGLLPGRIEQVGHDNHMGLTMTGTGNLFAMSQAGSGNTLTAMITGNNNQAAVVQIGSGNHISFTQNGNGNVLSVVQRSR